MKLVKTASGKQTIKISKSEWKAIGKKAGWNKTAFYGSTHKSFDPDEDYPGKGEYESQLGSMTPKQKRSYNEKQYVSRNGNMYSYMDLEGLPEPSSVKLKTLWDSGNMQEYLDAFEEIAGPIEDYVSAPNTPPETSADPGGGFLQ